MNYSRIQGESDGIDWILITFTYQYFFNCNSNYYNYNYFGSRLALHICHQTVQHLGRNETLGG